MKNFLCFAFIAITLQSCLKDTKSDVLAGVGADEVQVSFDAPYGTMATDPATIRTENLSYVNLVRRVGKATIKIPVVVTPRASTKNIVINIKNDDVTRVTAYNTANELTGTGVFLPMPAGKFVVPSSVTIEAGKTSAVIEISVPDGITDYDFYGKYMIALTLSSSDVVVYNPSTVLALSMENAYSGTFRYTGTAFTENALGVKGINVFTMDKVFTAGTRSETSSAFPVGYPNNPLRTLVFDFNQGVCTTGAGTCPDGTLTVVGSENAPSPTFPLTFLYGTTPPVISFDADGRLMSIKGIKYQWRQSAGPPVNLYKQEVDIVRVGK